MKRFLSMTIVAALFSCLLIGCIKASVYSMALNIGTGETKNSQVHNYTAGNMGVGLKANSFTKVDGLNYTRLSATLYNITGTITPIYVGTGTMRFTNTNEIEMTTYGYQEQGRKMFGFSTKVNGYNYGGLYSDNVTMTSGRD